MQLVIGCCMCIVYEWDMRARRTVAVDLRAAPRPAPRSLLTSLRLLLSKTTSSSQVAGNQIWLKARIDTDMMIYDGKSFMFTMFNAMQLRSLGN